MSKPKDLGHVRSVFCQPVSEKSRFIICPPGLKHTFTFTSHVPHIQNIQILAVCRMFVP